MLRTYKASDAAEKRDSTYELRGPYYEELSSTQVTDVCLSVYLDTYGSRDAMKCQPVSASETESDMDLQR